MKRIAIFAALAAAVAAQTPGVRTIMDRVGRNQAQAVEQRKYNFKLLAAEQYRGRGVYRIGFEPKPHQEFDKAAWKGEVEAACVRQARPTTSSQSPRRYRTFWKLPGRRTTLLRSACPAPPSCPNST